MGTDTLACLGGRAYGIAAGEFGARLNTPPPPAGTVPPPPPMSVVPLSVEEAMDLIDLAILSVVTLGSRIHLYLLIRLT